MELSMRSADHSTRTHSLVQCIKSTQNDVERERERGEEREIKKERERKRERRVPVRPLHRLCSFISLSSFKQSSSQQISSPLSKVFLLPPSLQQQQQQQQQCVVAASMLCGCHLAAAGDADRKTIAENNLAPRGGIKKTLPLPIQVLF
jgi:hypothetical protein